MITKELAISLSTLPIINEIKDKVKALEEMQPIAKEVEDKVFQKLKLDWNYNSNAIEGNQLNYGETVAFLMHGITAKGKTLKDHLDIKGHNEAINFLLSIVKDDRAVNETDIRNLHELILVEPYEVDAITPDGKPTKKRIYLGEYKTSPNSVKTRTGEMHYYASVEETPILMNELMQWYNACKEDKNIHPLVLAALFHYQFVAIHPFDDGNGRLARILMNLILMQHNLLPVVVKNEDKANYYGVLAQADVQQYIPLIDYMGNLLLNALNIKWKAIHGESIDEESDIDKEIALLKKSIDAKIIERQGKSKELLELRIKDSFDIVYKELDLKLKLLSELFFEYSYKYSYEESEFKVKRKIIKVLDLKNFYQSIIKYFNNYYYIIQFLLVRYKEDENFNITIPIVFDLDDIQYHILSPNHNAIISKYYNEPITKEEVDNFVNAVMKDIINEIKQASNTINE